MMSFSTTVFCDRCGRCEESEEAPETAIWEFENDGWLLNSNLYAVGLDLCPECRAEEEEEDE